MLFHDKFVKRSLSNFLHLDCLLNINSEDIKEKFSYFIIKNTEENREKIFSHVPEDFFTEFIDEKEKYLKITKANLLRYQKKQMTNPIRTWGNDDEYNTRLITSLLFQATPGWHEYCTNLYDHGQDRYIHDQRAGGGRAKQFLNWMYSDEGYPGRLEEQNKYENLIPLCFPNPELLKSYFSYAGGGQYALTILDNWENTVLYQKLNELKLLHQFTIQEPDGKKKIKGVIIASFYAWQKAIAEILKEQSLEKDLSLEQQKTHVISLIIEFVKNKQDIKQLKMKVTDFIRSINKEKTENIDQQENQLSTLDSQFIREPITIIKNDEIKRQLNEKLESCSNLKKGAALKTGDCFFDSLAQGLNELKEKGIIQYNGQFTVKSLRDDCSNYASKNREPWAYKKIICDARDDYFVERKNLDGNAIIDPSINKTIIEEGDIFNKYLQDIKNISEENGPLPIWGRLNIEGKMICEKYNVKIQVINVLEDIEDNKYLIEESGYITESEEGESENVVHMLNYKQHFVPLLSKIEQDVTKNQQVSKEEIYGKEIADNVPIKECQTTLTDNQDNKLTTQKAIKALYKIRKNITANKEFFDKFTNDKGVLQAEQYFRALTTHIDSEITFLVTFQNVLTEKDLDTFLNQTCKEVHSDINELLLAHDFLLTDDLEHRDIVINFTRKEIKELYQHISDKIKDYKGDEKDKYEWLLYQLKSHPLFEFFNVKNTNGVQVKVGELWKMVEDNNSNKESNKSNFICGLTEVINGCTDNKSKVYIKQSRWLAFKQWLYNISYYVPLSSIWLSYVNPGKSRTKTKYKGETPKKKLYTKNRAIQTSEFSQNIREALKFSKDDTGDDTNNKKFVESKHEASWLIKEFRKKHRLSGAKEKVLTYLGKNKILWYTLLTIFILFTSAAAIAGRVLSYLGIVPPVVVDRMINSLRGIFDGFAVMFGLDTIIDSIFILAIDLASLIVRCVDYILLFGLVSKTIRYLTKGISKVVQGMSSGFKALYETIRIYGLKGSLILLHNKITNNKQLAGEERCETEEKIEKKKDIIMGQEHNIDNILSSIQKLWQESQKEGHQSSSKRIVYVFNNLKSQIEIDLVGRDIKFPKLSKNFSNIHDLFKSATDWNFIRFQYEFHYLLNKYPKKFSIGVPTSNGQIQCAKKDITIENYRMKMYDVMAAVSLQIKLVKEEGREYITSIGAKKVIRKINDQNNREKVSLEILDKKIAAIGWARNALENSDIDFAIKKAEPVFQITKAHISTKVALHDYSKKLEEFRKRISKPEGEQVSVDELNAYEMIFTRYITDAHYMLSSIDQFMAKNHEGNSLHQFREAFSDNGTLFAPPSHGAKNAALIFGIERGGVSLFSRVKEYTVDFVKEFQDPKIFAIAFAAYYIAVQIPGLLNVAHTITDVPEIMLDHVGLGMVYDHFLETDVGRVLIEMVYQRGELLKDVWVLCNEFKDGVIGESELKKRWSEIKQEVKKTKSHCDHHEHGNSKERLISFINGFVHFILTTLGINFIRSLLHNKNKVKAEYRTFSSYYQEGQHVANSSKIVTLDKAKGNQNIVDDDMHNLKEIKTSLKNDPEYIKNILNKMIGMHLLPEVSTCLDGQVQSTSNTMYNGQIYT